MTADSNAGQADRILIVEDQQEVLTQLTKTIEKIQYLEVCGTEGNLDTALTAFYKFKPRLVLTDLVLPDGSGVDIIKAASGADWPCDSLVLSAFGDERRVLEAICAGARGYILKNSGTATIGEDIQTVLEGGCPISPQIAHYLLSLVKLHHTPSTMPEMRISLTDREIEILSEVARGYKRAEIGQKLGISVGSVGNHINRIYKKLEVGSNIEAVSKAKKMGLL